MAYSSEKPLKRVTIPSDGFCNPSCSADNTTNTLISLRCSMGPSVDSIESIKQAFIELNQLPASNESVMPDELCPERLKRVKLWLADRERQYGIQAEMNWAPEDGVKSKYAVYANDIDSHSLALQAYDYAVIGTHVVPDYIDAKHGDFWGQFADGLTDPQKKLLTKRFAVNVSDQTQLVKGLKLYVAELAALDVHPTFLQRREAWQRAMVRMVYKKLPWSSDDLHYLIHRARKAQEKKAKQ